MLTDNFASSGSERGGGENSADIVYHSSGNLRIRLEQRLWRDVHLWQTEATAFVSHEVCERARFDRLRIFNAIWWHQTIIGRHVVGHAVDLVRRLRTSTLLRHTLKEAATSGLLAGIDTQASRLSHPLFGGSGRARPLAHELIGFKLERTATEPKAIGIAQLRM